MMYIATKMDREPAKGIYGDQASTRNRHLDRERRQFIREAAIRICVEHRRRDEIWDMSTRDAKDIWRAASKLWSERPEDC